MCSSDLAGLNLHQLLAQDGARGHGHGLDHAAVVDDAGAHEVRQEPVKIEAGSTADLTVIDPEAVWTVEVEDFCSKANNSGFIGAELVGRATDVYVGGWATMEDGAIVE